MTKDKKVHAPDISGVEESLLNATSENVQKSTISYEDRLNFVNEISQPMAGRKLTKKIYKLIKKASKNREYCKSGLKLVQSSIRKGATGLIILAGDVTPVDVMIHLPAVCEDKDIPYCYVPSKEDIGTAMGVTRGVISVLIIDNPEIQDNFVEVLNEVKALPIPF
uniref:Putative nucleolar protein nhp2 n=1 Tax=Panstrongylus lignarius TaxID=156445 RepID=A0A224Y000_9HEMI